MPTGYTSDLYDGKDQTFPEFVLNCARAFGALVELRDSPNAEIPAEFQPDDYYERSVQSDRAALSRLMDMSGDEIVAAADADWHQQVATHRESERKRLAMKARYESMLQQVRQWTPPTPEHEELKKFMEQQLTESIRFDCTVWDLPPRKTAEQWHADRLASTTKSLQRSIESRNEAVQRAKERTQWVRDLRSSLPSFEPAS